MIAIKYNEDDYYANSHYAKVGGISLNELNHLERDFIDWIDFRVFVTKDIYDKYYEYLTYYYKIVSDEK
jgi:hypothetical protein